MRSSLYRVGHQAFFAAFFGAGAGALAAAEAAIAAVRARASRVFFLPCESRWRIFSERSPLPICILLACTRASPQRGAGPYAKPRSPPTVFFEILIATLVSACLLYTSDAADE